MVENRARDGSIPPRLADAQSQALVKIIRALRGGTSPVPDVDPVETRAKSVFFIGLPADELQRIAAKMRPQTIPDYQFIPASDPRDSRCLSSPVALFRDRNQTLERTARSNCRVPVIFLEKRRPLSETPPPPITAPCARTLFSDCRSATLKDFGPPAPPLPPSWMQPGAHRLPAIPPRLRIYWRPPQQGRALCWRSPQQGRAV